MLDRESQRLDLQEVGLAEEYAKRVYGVLGIQPGTQAPERVGMVRIDVELLDQLSIHSFDDLPYVLKSR
jgi:hypothetical protein